MEKDNKALYEKIMRSVSKEVKRALNEGWEEVKQKTELATQVSEAVEEKLKSFRSNIEIDGRENGKSSFTDEKYLGPILHFTVKERKKGVYTYSERKYEFGFLTRYDKFVLFDITTDRYAAVLFINPKNNTLKKIVDEVYDWADTKIYGFSIF